MSRTSDELLLRAANGDANAVNFLKTFTGIADIWDDLVDRDREVGDDEINAAFQAALFTLPANAFYAKWRHLLDPLMLVAVVNWRAATARERFAPSEWTFIARSDYVNVVAMVMVITGGIDAAVQFMGELRDTTHAEGMAGYLAAIKHEGH